MADVNANIGVQIDTSDALAQLKSLQRQLSQFHTSVAKSSATAAAAQKSLQKNLIGSINSIGAFSAELRTVKTSAESFTNSLEKNKFSMREYFRYAGASTKTFGRLFTAELDTVTKVAEDRVKKLQTQYIKLGRDSQGAMKAIAVMPNQLDFSNTSTQLQMAAQKQAIFNQLLKQGSTNLLNFGKNTQWAGRQLMVGFTIPLGILGMRASQTFMDMEKAALKFRKVYGDLLTSPEETKAALDGITELGKQYTKYGVAVADTVSLSAEAAAAGFQGLDLQRQTAQATRLSVLGQIDAQQALETTIALQNAFKMSSEDLAGSIDFLNAVENQTVTSLDDITIAIPKVAPVIQQLGGDVKDLAFFLTAMKEGGINASEGANALKSGLAAIINPTNKAKAMLAELGINITKIVESNKGDIKSTVVDFAQALDTLDPLTRARAIEQLFGKFQFARLSTLFQNVTKDGTQASRVLNLAGSSIQELATLAEKELAMTADSPMNQFKKAVEDLKIALVPVGEVFLKTVTPILDFFGSLLSKFAGLSDNTKKIITIITVALAGVGPVLLMTFGLLANGVANIIKLFATLRNGYLRLTGQSQMLGEQTQYMTMEQLEAAAAAHSLNQSHATLKQTFDVEKASLDQLIASYQSAARASAAFAAANPGSMLPIRGGKRPKKFAVGKPYVVGGSGNRDSEPAMLAPGETVIPADMSKKYGKLINGMIAGNIPGYRRGLTAEDSDFAKSIVSRAPLKSQAGILKFLEKEMQAMPETLVEEFKNLVTTVAKETKLSATSLERQLKDFRTRYVANMLQQEKEQFAHLDTGRRVKAGELQASGAVTDPKTQARLTQFIDAAGADALVDLKTGFGVSLTGFLNNAMQGAGASLQDVLADFEITGVQKFRDTIEMGGGTMAEFGPELEQFDKQFTKNLQIAYDRGARIIVDSESQIDEMRTKALARGEKFDDKLYVAMDTVAKQTKDNVVKLGSRLDKVFNNAINRITEIRYQGITPEQNAKLPAGFGRGSKGGRVTPGSTSYGRGSVVVGSFNNAPAAVAGAADAKLYSKAVEANTQDAYMLARDRKSPHPQAIKDGNDDGTAYSKGVQAGVKKASQSSQAAASRQALYGEGPIDATAKSIRRQEQARARRNTAAPVASATPGFGSRLRSAGGRFAGSMRGARGMGISSGLMMASQFVPGKAGDIAGQVSSLAFIGQALMQLPRAAGVAGAAITAVGYVYKKLLDRQNEQNAVFKSTFEPAKTLIAQLGDTAIDTTLKITGITDGVKDLKAAVLGVDPVVQGLVDEIKKLPEDDSLSKFVKNISDSGLKTSSLIGSIRSQVTSAIATGGLSPENAQKYVQALLVAANKSKEFGKVWSKVSADTQNTQVATTSYLNKLVQALDSDYNFASLYNFSANDRFIKSYKELNVAGKVAADGLENLFAITSNGSLSFKQASLRIDALKKSALNGKVGVDLLTSAIRNSKDPDAIARLERIKELYGETGDAAKLSASEILIANQVLQLTSEKALGEWAFKNKLGPLNSFARIIAFSKSSDFKKLQDVVNQIVNPITPKTTTTTTTPAPKEPKWTLAGQLQKDIQELNNQRKAFAELTASGVETQDALELIKDQQIAAAIATGGMTSKVLYQIKNFLLLKKATEDLSKTLAPYGERMKSVLAKQEAMFDLREEVAKSQYANQIYKETEALREEEYQLEITNRLIKQQEEAMAALVDPKQKRIDEISYQLEGISFKEDEINEKYDRQSQLLSTITKMNQDLFSIQKKRTSLADALSSGDISAAASIIMEMRAEEASIQASSQQDVLDAAREQELSALGRVALEKESRKLQYEILSIQRSQSTEYQDQAKIIQKNIDAIQASLSYYQEQLADNIATINAELTKQFGKSKSDIQSAMKMIDLANVAGFDINSPTLITNILNKSLDTAKQIKKIMNEVAKVEEPAPRPSNLPNTEYNFGTYVPPSGYVEVPTPSNLPNTKYNLGTYVPTSGYVPDTTVDTPATNTGQNNPSADNGFTFDTSYGTSPQFGSNTPWAQAAARFSMGGLVPKYFAKGGFNRGTDTVPAMLTPGEFVVNRRATAGLGIDTLNKINNGEVLAGSVYNYKVDVTLNGSDMNPNDVANAVLTKIKQLESRNIRRQGI